MFRPNTLFTWVWGREANREIDVPMGLSALFTRAEVLGREANQEIGVPMGLNALVTRAGVRRQLVERSPPRRGASVMHYLWGLKVFHAGWSLGGKNAMMKPGV